MTPLSRATVRCTRCRATGVLPEGGFCPLCEGDGEYRRLVIPIKIVAAADLLSNVDLTFRRMAVVLANRGDDGTVECRGVTDRGLGLVASVASVRYDEIAHSDFIEATTWWAP